MAQSIDTKIVELKFNNDNFADKVDSTLTKLENLNEEIKRVGVKDAFKNLGIGTKNIDKDLSGVTKGVEEASKGFSKMEVLGITAMANISNSVVNLGKKMVSNLIKPLTQGVIQGGLSRARNIEQATFQFEGQKIGKSKAHRDVGYYHEVMEAVLGTSYSYDVAARAASQLAASNVGVSKTMKTLADGSKTEALVLNGGMTKALLGIAGVAAMTGRNFDDVAQVFTRVAGQGKVMANDLNSIASYGLNAAAVLGQSLGKTEAEIREMVKKGDIDFKMFSKAMSDAFGAHAKDSTLMFQGALDDVNAALARIGADFYGPALTAGRDILNSVTPLVDAIHTKLNPALEGSGNLMETASQKLSQYLDMLSYIIEKYPSNDTTGWIKEHMNAWTNIADLYKTGNLKDAVKGLKEYSKTWEGMEGKAGISGYRMLWDYLGVGSNKDLLSTYLNKTDKQFDKMVKKGKVNVEDMKTVINGMIDDGTIGFNTFYKSFHKLWSESTDLMGMKNINEFFNEYVRLCLDGQESTERFSDNVRTMFAIFDGARSLISSIGQILGGFASIFLTVAQHLAPLGTTLVESTKEFAKFVVEVADAIATSEKFANIIDSVVSLLKRFFELLHIDKAAQAVLYGITKAFDFLANAIDRVVTGVSIIASKINGVFQKIADGITEILSSSVELSKIVKSLKGAGVVVLLLRLTTALTRPAELLDLMRNTLKSLSGSIDTVLTTIGGAFKQISDVAGSVVKFIDNLTTTLKRMQELIIATAILEIAFAIGVLAGSFYLLSKIDYSKSEQIIPLLLTFFSIIGTLGAAKKILGSIEETIKIWERSVNSFIEIGSAMVEFAVAVAIMAGAIYMLAKIDTKQLITATGAIEVLLVTLALMAKFLSNTTTKDTGLKALWSGKKTSTNITKGLFGLIGIAEAIKIVAKAMTEVASITDPDRLWDSLLVIELLMWTMTAIVKLLSGDKAAKMTKGVGSLLAMALAVRMLTKPIAELAGIDSTAMFNATGAIIALMGALSIFTQMMSGAKGMIKIGIGLVLVAASIKILQDAVVAFSTLNPESLVTGILGVIGLLAAMVITLDMLNTEKILVKAIALVLVAHMLKELQDVVMTFGQDFDSAIKGLVAIGVALTGLLFVVYAFEAAPIVGILKLFTTLMLGAVVVTAFGVAVGVFGVAVAIFGAGLTSMAAGITALSEVMPQFLAFMVGFAIAVGLLSSVGLRAVGVILALSLAFLLLGAGFKMMGDGLVNIATSIELINELKGELGNLSWNIINFVKDLSKIKDEAGEVGASFEEIAKPLRSLRKSVDEISANIDKLIASYDQLKTDTVGCIETLATALTTVSQLNQDSFTQASEAVKGFISELNSVSGDSATVSQAATDISASIDTLNTALEGALNTLSTFQQRIRLFDAIGQSLSSIAEPIESLNNMRSELDGLVQDIVNFVNNLKTLKDNASVVSEGTAAISAALDEVGDSASVAAEVFDSFSMKTASVLGEMGKGLSNIASGVESLAKNRKALSEAGSTIETFFTKLEGVVASADEISDGVNKVSKAVKKLGNASKGAVDTKAMASSGQQIIDGFIKGMNDRKGNVATKVEGIVDNANNKVKKRRTAFQSTGSYLIEGMVVGIRSQQAALEAEVVKLEQKAERAVQAKAKINSPSRVWMQIGAYMGEGLAIGIRNSGTEVKHASIGLASVSEDAVSSAIDAISSAIESGWDTNPTIRPVVDLSNVDRSAKDINSAFSGTVGFGSRSIRLAGSVNGGAIQNGRINSIDKLARKIDGMTETMNSRSLNVYNTIDGTADPEAFADGLIRSFRLNARTV